jgi:retron-type reverse transcriptase
LKNLCKQQNISLFCAENDLNEGDIDLSKFFDRIHHDRLIARMGQRIIDKRILRLVGLMLRSGVMIDGVVMRRTLVGTSYLSYLTGDVNFC